MTYAARETSTYQGEPYELFLFQNNSGSWRYTSGDTARVYLGQTYQPEAITRTEIGQDGEAKSGSIKISLPRSNDLSSRYISYIPSTPVYVTIFRGHDADSEVVTHFTGKVASATFTDECELEVVPEQEALRRGVPTSRFQRPCNRVLYDGGCGVDRTAFRVTGTISSISADTMISSAFAAKPDGWFTAGYVEYGDERRMVISHTGNTLQLITPFATLVVGGSVNAYAGCQRTESDCATKFNNLPNFFGFTKIPTRNPFDGLN